MKKIEKAKKKAEKIVSYLETVLKTAGRDPMWIEKTCQDIYSDILQYEIYSGAGEHLRHQMAGGDVTQEERPELKVKNDQALNWEFKGEIWEDEVGHYRSSLKNVCPQNNESEEKGN